MSEQALKDLASSADRLADDAIAVLNTLRSGDRVASPNPFGLFPDILETSGIAGSFSTWFEYWGGIVGAAHSVEAWPEDRALWPEWTQGKELIIRPRGLDVALFGCTLPERPPAALRDGDRVRLRGYPAGVTNVDHYEIRNGIAYMDRPEEMRNGEAPSWIIQFDDGSVLAMGGMSGGVGTTILPDGSEAVTSLIITQNNRADLDGDGDADHSSDVTEMIDVWSAVMRAKETSSA